MAGFGVVWTAIIIIIVTPLLGGLMTKIAFDLSENHIKIRRKEREYVSTVKKSSTVRSNSTNGSEEEMTIRSQQTFVSEKKNKNEIIRRKLHEFKEELTKLTQELNE